MDEQNSTELEALPVGHAIASAVDQNSGGEPDQSSAAATETQPEIESPATQDGLHASVAELDLSLEKLDRLPSFHRLTGQQALLILRYLTNGGRGVQGALDAKILAVQQTFGPLPPSQARLDAYRYFSNSKVEAVLDEFFETPFREQIMRAIDRAIRSPKTSVGQVEALRLKLDMVSAGLSKPGSGAKSEDDSAA